MGFNVGHWLSHVIAGASKNLSGQVLGAARNALPPQLQQGFDQAVSAIQVDPSNLLNTRVNIDPSQLPGFDLASHIAGGLSQASGVPIPQGLSPAGVAGFLATHGMQGADPAANQVVMTTIATNPNMKAGATAAIQQIAAVRAKEGWWRRLLRKLGLVH